MPREGPCGVPAACALGARSETARKWVDELEGDIAWGYVNAGGINRGGWGRFEAVSAGATPKRFTGVHTNTSYDPFELGRIIKWRGRLVPKDD